MMDDSANKLLTQYKAKGGFVEEMMCARCLGNYEYDCHIDKSVSATLHLSPGS